MKKIALILVALNLSACASLSTDKPALITSMERDLGRSRPGNCPSRWCACYLENKLQAHGYNKRGSWRARDFATYGRATTAQRGAIMVQRNHVAVVTGICSDGRIQAISGNHRKRVGIGCYSRASIIAFRKISD